LKTFGGGGGGYTSNKKGCYVFIVG